MNTAAPAPPSSDPPVWIDRYARTAVSAVLSRVVHGRLLIIDHDSSRSFGAVTDICPLDVTITVVNPRFYSYMLFGGSVGAAEAYMAGYWTTSDLTAVVRIMVLNRHVLEHVESGFAKLLSPARKLIHWLNRNTRSGSKKNIVAHYDLGNDFFSLFLDPTMTYSAGIFEHDDFTLELASHTKLDRICRKLALTPDDAVLEIGTGWGSFALHAAAHYGCHVTTTTISEEQYTLARTRIDQAGLSDKITLLKQDYRDLNGTFSKVVSIEMIEAVGYEFYDTYFHTISSLLKPDGMALIQAIIIDDRAYDSAIKSVDFIQRYIFPGSCIPSITAILQSVKRATDMRLFHCEDITAHYARTLREWHKNFMAAIDAVKAQGYSDQFIRMWEFYLCYCEGGFAERHIGDVHLLFTKPLCRREPILGTLKAEKKE